MGDTRRMMEMLHGREQRNNGGDTEDLLRKLSQKLPEVPSWPEEDGESAHRRVDKAKDGLADLLPLETRCAAEEASWRMSSAGACPCAGGAAEGQRMAKTKATCVPPPAGRTLALEGNPRAGGERRSTPLGSMMYFCF